MKMIQGARGLAAALGGARVYKRVDGEWSIVGGRSGSAAQHWRALHDREDDAADDFGVRAEDARRVLG